MAKTRRRITRELKNEMLSYRAKGYSVAEIAKKCNVGINTVCRHTKDKKGNFNVINSINKEKLKVVQSIVSYEYEGVDFEFVVDYNSKSLALGFNLGDVDAITPDNKEILRQYAEILLSLYNDFDNLVSS